MEYPTEIWEIVKQAATRCKSRQGACHQAEKKIRAHPEFKSFVDSLVGGAVEELIGHARHAANVRMRSANSAMPKVVVGKSPSVLENYDLYLYRIGGNDLGNMTKEDLQAIAVCERESAAGHIFNARRVDRLAPLVPKGKTVQQAVNKTKLDSVWRDADRETGKAA